MIQITIVSTGKHEGDFDFVEEIKGGVIPVEYIPACRKGFEACMEKGSLIGFPIVGVRVTINDGNYHGVDSSEMAFKIAASMCLKKAVQEASPTLLEPIMQMEITVPEEVMGDVMGDLNGRRGRVLGMDGEGKYQIIKANAPMAEVLQYALDLNSITAGRGTFSMEFSHYEEMPAQLAEKVVAAAQEKE